MLILRTITFLAAFLLFQIELISAKILLPHYGGSYFVWGACVVFFQAFLLLGYVFAHYAIAQWGVGRYRFMHIALLLIPLLFFPGRPLMVEHVESGLPLALEVFWRLSATIGPVFFVLSTISIATQVWLAASQRLSQNNPYSLYAVSSAGSFGALLTYPFVLEVYTDLPTQMNIWRGLYFVLIGLNLLACIKVDVKDARRDAARKTGPLDVRDRAYWLLLGAGAVIVFLSVNNIITNEIAPVPLLWVIPLCLYLLSFVFNFQQRPWCPSWIVREVHLILGLSAVLFFLVIRNYFPFMIELVLLTVSQFVLCMYCQNQLITHRPKDNYDLTRFYVLVSSGGFLGGIFTAWIIPLISRSPVEYLVGLVVIAAALAIKDGKKFSMTRDHTLWFIVLMFVASLWPLLFMRYNVFILVSIVMIFKIIYTKFQKSAYGLLLSLTGILAAAYYAPLLWNPTGSVHVKRNYYGISEIVDAEGVRSLNHSGTLHGAQYLRADRRGEPLAYYAHDSAAGKILLADQFSFDRLGLIGLGAGTLSVYTREDQVMDIYEIDPDIYRIADKYFTYIHEAKGKLNFILGDARVSLDKNPGAKYDFILVDAFSGDTIPIHLLTKEAIEKYRDHLNEEGVLVLHLSNRYLDLKHVVTGVGEAAGAYLAGNLSGHPAALGGVSRWMVMTWDKDVFDTLVSELGWVPPPAGILRKNRIWTDQYSSILPDIRSGDLLDSIKNFRPFFW